MSFDSRVLDPYVSADPRVFYELESLGRVVRRARRREGMPQRELAARSGVSQSSISRLERGLSPRAPLHRLASLAVALHLSIGLDVRRTLRDTWP